MRPCSILSGLALLHLVGSLRRQEKEEEEEALKGAEASSSMARGGIE
jgi:type II secretory pathway pseudopilin PulG